MGAPRKIKAQITYLREIGDKIRLIRFKPYKSIKNKFKPGQFLHLSLDEYDPSNNWPDSRVFSIATSPERAEEIEIIISLKGYYTQRIFNEISIGKEVWIKLPFGDFNFEAATNRSTILIAGGSGISPFISFLEYAIDNNLSNNILLFYGVSEPKNIIIETLLAESREKLKNFKFELFIENNQESNHLSIPNLPGVLPVKSIAEKALLFENANYYLSGPAAMIQSFNNELLGVGISEDNIVFDNWE